MGKRDAAAVSADRLGAEFESFRRMTDDVYWKVQQRAKAGAPQRSMFMLDGNNLVHRRPGGQGGGNRGGNTGGPAPPQWGTLPDPAVPALTTRAARVLTTRLGHIAPARP